MLAILTGLLLTLGGDQPAVYIDPPLDPEIFQWDEKGLVLTNISSEVQLLSWIEESSERPKFIFYADVLWMGSDTEPYGWNLDGSISDCYYLDYSLEFIGPFDTSPSVKLFSQIERFKGGQYLELFRIRMCPGKSFEFQLVDDLAKTERIDDLQQRIELLEESLESCQCASDLDGDGAVGFTDLVELISVWGPCSA